MKNNNLARLFNFVYGRPKEVRLMTPEQVRKELKKEEIDITPMVELVINKLAKK